MNIFVAPEDNAFIQGLIFQETPADMRQYAEGAGYQFQFIPNLHEGRGVVAVGKCDNVYVLHLSSKEGYRSFGENSKIHLVGFNRCYGWPHDLKKPYGFQIEYKIAQDIVGRLAKTKGVPFEDASGDTQLAEVMADFHLDGEQGYMSSVGYQLPVLTGMNYHLLRCALVDYCTRTFFGERESEVCEVVRVPDMGRGPDYWMWEQIIGSYNSEDGTERTVRMRFKDMDMGGEGKYMYSLGFPPIEIYMTALQHESETCY